MKTKSFREKHMWPRDDRWTNQDTNLQPGDGQVVPSDGALDLVGDGDDVDAALKFVVQHAGSPDLRARARGLAAFRSTGDDNTIVAICRDPPP